MNTTNHEGHDTASLNEMIEVLNDGKQFYAQAATEVKRPDLQSLFRRMAATKGDIASQLQVRAQALGEKPAAGGSFSGALQKLYAEVRVKMTSDPDHEYVAQLEEFEDRIKHAFESAAASSDDSAVRRIADKYLSSVEKDHDLMRDLKKNDPRAKASP